MDALNTLTWSEPQLINTRVGPKLIRKATPNEDFWKFWREHKIEIKAAGIELGQWPPRTGQWLITWWERDGAFKLPDIKVVEKVELPELPPLKNTEGLLPYQPQMVANILWAMDNIGASLNACGTGLGKTFMTLGAIRERGRRALIICPKTIVRDWMEAAIKLGVPMAGVYGWEWIKTGKTQYLQWTRKRVTKKVGDGFVLVDKKDKLIWNVPADVDLVFDEAHRAANDDTQNSRMAQDAVTAGLPIFALSATIADSPLKMRAIGYALKLHNNGKDYYDWMGRNGVTKGRYGLEFSGNKTHLQALHHSIFPTKGIRVRPEQLGDAFPQNQTLAKAYTIDESKEIASIYSEMMEKCKELQEKGANAACIMVEILRARQRVELLKVPLMVSLTRDACEEGNSVFLAVNFRETLQHLIKQLNIQSVIIGGQKPEHRTEAITAFQANRTNIIAGIMKACREGISLHDLHGEHPRMSFIMPGPSVLDLKQVLGRIWRAGGKTPSIQRILFARDTIEEDVCFSLATKLDRLDLICDGDLQKGIFPAAYSDMRIQTDNEEDV